MVIIRVSLDMPPGLVPDHIDGVLLETPPGRPRRAFLNVATEDGSEIPLVAMPTGWHEILPDGQSVPVLMINP